MKRSRIVGTGGYLPGDPVTNAALAASVDTSDEWIVERTGIRQRHLAADGEFTLDLAEAAARRAMEAASVSAGEIDLIVVATTTPDRVFPSTACLLQSRLGVHGCPAFDVQAVCTGFVYALAVADKFVATGAARTALVVGAETSRASSTGPIGTPACCSATGRARWCCAPTTPPASAPRTCTPTATTRTCCTCRTGCRTT